MIDFAEKARITQLADDTLEKILSKSYDNFEQYEEVSKITELEVAKIIIKRLLDKVDESNRTVKEVQQKEEPGWFHKITDRLKNRSADSFWCDENGQILVPTESAADAIADMLELLYRSQGKEISVNTEYYDPKEDKRDECEDYYTGWWCVTIEQENNNMVARLVSVETNELMGILTVKNKSAEEVQEKVDEIKNLFDTAGLKNWGIQKILDEFPDDWQWNYYGDKEKTIKI